MNKLNLIFIIIGVLVVGILAFSIFAPKPAIEADEDSPLAFDDSFDTMDAEIKAEFDKMVEINKDNVVEMMEPKDSEANLLSQAFFKPRAHGVEGKALLIEDGPDIILRFEDFETINGPNLHIYLSSDLGSSDFIDLGEIKATKGNVNYDIPLGTDLTKYDKVLVWCVPFKVLFSYADLG